MWCEVSYPPRPVVHVYLVSILVVVDELSLVLPWFVQDRMLLEVPEPVYLLVEIGLFVTYGFPLQGHHVCRDNITFDLQLISFFCQSGLLFRPVRVTYLRTQQ